MTTVKYLDNGLTFNGRETTKQRIINLFEEAAKGASSSESDFYRYLDGSLGKALNVIGESVHDERLQHFGETTLYLPGEVSEDLHEMLRGMREQGVPLWHRYIFVRGVLSAIPVGLTPSALVQNSKAVTAIASALGEAIWLLMEPQGIAQARSL